MVDREGDPSAHGQLANGVYHGPGCNGQFEAYEQFYKFVHPEMWSWKEDRPSYAAFRKERESVSWGALATPNAIRAKRPGFGVVSVHTSICVFLEQTIEYTPNLPNFPDTPEHCDVVGIKEKKGDRSIARRFALCATPWARPVPLDRW